MAVETQIELKWRRLEPGKYKAIFNDKDFVAEKENTYLWRLTAEGTLCCDTFKSVAECKKYAVEIVNGIRDIPHTPEGNPYQKDRKFLPRRRRSRGRAQAETEVAEAPVEAPVEAQPEPSEEEKLEEETKPFAQAEAETPVEPTPDKPPYVEPSELNADEAAEKIKAGMEALGLASKDPRLDAALHDFTGLRAEIDKLKELLASGDFGTSTDVVTVKGGEQTTKKIKGKTHKQFKRLLRILNTRNTSTGYRMNAMLVGPSGSGKTTIASQCAEAIGLDFYLSGALLNKYELLGFVRPDGQLVRSPFRDAYENGGVFLWDEMDGSDARAMVAFNSALENKYTDFPDGTIEKHPDFVCIGAANTYGHGATLEYQGRNPLDGATLQRFKVLRMDYDTRLERGLVAKEYYWWVDKVQYWRKAAIKHHIRHIISPRASIDGAALLAAGGTQQEVEEECVWQGLEKNQVEKIKRECE